MRGIGSIGAVAPGPEPALRLARRIAGPDTLVGWDIHDFDGPGCLHSRSGGDIPSASFGVVDIVKLDGDALEELVFEAPSLVAVAADRSLEIGRILDDVSDA
jgi:hypothetical protein